MISTCAYIYTVSRENALLCEKFDMYIGNFGGNNVKGKIANVVSNKLRDLCLSLIHISEPTRPY